MGCDLDYRADSIGLVMNLPPFVRMNLSGMSLRAIFGQVVWFRRNIVLSDGSALTAARFITFENLRVALPTPERKTGTSRFSSGDGYSNALATEICVKFVVIYCLLSILQPIKIHHLTKETSERDIAAEKNC